MGDNSSVNLKEGMDLAGFSLLKLIGEGGMGTVWLAEQKSMSRTVALKVLTPNPDAPGDFTARFLKEVQISAKLNHPNIVIAHDAGEKDGLHFLAMEYVEGKTLDDLLFDNDKLPEEKSLRIVRTMAQALDYAWSEFKILHRDIKPSNIIFDKNDVPKLLDMGISKCLTEDTSITVTGILIGTPCYISPEQVMAEEDIDCRTDIYSLGVLLYHILTGKTPFAGENAMQLVMQHIHEPPPDITSENPAVSMPCALLIQKMMAKKREFRQKDWKELITDIDLVLAGKCPTDTDIQEAEDFPSAEGDVKKTRVEPKPDSPFTSSPKKEETPPEPPETPEVTETPQDLEIPVKEKKKRSLKAKDKVTLIMLGIVVLAVIIFFWLRSQSKESDKEKIRLPIKIDPSTQPEDYQTPLDINPIDENSGTIEKRPDFGDPENWLLKKTQAEKDAEVNKELDENEAKLDEKMKGNKGEEKKKRPENKGGIPSIDGTKWEENPK